MFGRWFALVLLLVMGTCCTGCAAYSGGQIYSSPAWLEGHGRAGKVFLIVAGEQNRDEAGDDYVKAHTTAVSNAAVEAINRLPETSVINAGELPPLWLADMGDAQAVTEAKAHGADTACVLTVGAYGGMFYISLPVLWNVHTDILYSLRLIDVKTGDLLAHAVIHREGGGNFSAVPFNDLEDGMAKSLRYSLPVPKPAGAATSAPQAMDKQANDAKIGVSG